ncbi:MAG: hypothetical protein WD600_10705, partial [Pseudohongiella sp.]
MQHAKRRPLSLFVASIIAGLSITATDNLAAQDNTEESVLEEVIVTGARGRPRTVSDSPVPIDVF